MIMKTAEVKQRIEGKTASGKVDFLLSLNQSNNLKICVLSKALRDARAMLAAGLEADDPLWFTQQEAAILDPIDEALERAGESR
jgi:hypothetical protein